MVVDCRRSTSSLLGEYYRQHALTAFEEMRIDPDMHDAEYLLTVIRRLGESEVSRRDLHTASSRSRFPRANDLDPSLRILEEHWYLTAKAEQSRGPGRPRSPRWEVNPAVWASG